MSSVLDHAVELERLLLAHDVTVFGYERAGDLAVVRFVLNERKLRLVVKMPDFNDDAYKLTPTRREIRSIEQRRRLYWADVRKVWQGMRNLIGAKLEGVDLGITTFEAEFEQFADAEGLLGTGK